MARRFFSPEDPLWRTVSAVADAMALSFLWFFCCLPVVTAGPATAALYRAALACLRPMEPGAVRTFFRAFRANLKTGIPAGLLLLAMGSGGAWCVYVLRQAAAAGSRLAYALVFSAAVVCLFLLGCMGYVLPTLGRFSHPLGRLLRLCAALAVAHLPVTLALGGLLAFSAAALRRFWVLLAFLPAVTALLSSFLLEPVFRSHGGGDPPPPG